MVLALAIVLSCFLASASSFCASMFTRFSLRKKMAAGMGRNIIAALAAPVHPNAMAAKIPPKGPPTTMAIACQIAKVVGGPLGGILAAMAFGWTGAASAAIMFLPIPAAIFFLKEKRVNIDAQKLLADARKQLRTIAKAKTMWAAAGFSFLFYFAPGISTALFYRQQNDLHMSTKQQGLMFFLNGIF